MAITTGSANQRPNTPCIRLWIDVTFRGLEDSYTDVNQACMAICKIFWFAVTWLTHRKPQTEFFYDVPWKDFLYYWEIQ